MQNKVKELVHKLKKLLKSKNIQAYILFGLNIIVIDRITKYLALHFHEVYFAPFQRIFHLPPIRNYGMSFNLFFLSYSVFIWILRIIGLIITGYFVQRAIQKYQRNKKIFAEIAVVAGAIGNLIDRFYYGFVIDFIFFTFPLTNYIAIANIADFSITLGCIYLVFDIFIEDIIYS